MRPQIAWDDFGGVIRYATKEILSFISDRGNLPKDIERYTTSDPSKVDECIDLYNKEQPKKTVHYLPLNSSQILLLKKKLEDINVMDKDWNEAQLILSRLNKMLS